MDRFDRKLKTYLTSLVSAKCNIILFGAKFTGKKAIVSDIVADIRVFDKDIGLCLAYKGQPEQLKVDIIKNISKNQEICRVVVADIEDHLHLIPIIEEFIEETRVKFILTCSSLTNLKKYSIDIFHPKYFSALMLEPLSLAELKELNCQLVDLLLYGTLPQICLLKDSKEQENQLLIYLEQIIVQQVRAVRIVKNPEHFVGVLQILAENETGFVNVSEISRKNGGARKTILSYFQLLEDCFLLHKVPPIVEQPKLQKRKLASSEKYLFADLGVKRVAANIGCKLPTALMAKLFSQFVGIELLKIIRENKLAQQLKYWRDLNGPEIDWIISNNDENIPVLVKYTDYPDLSDIKHLTGFLKDYSQTKSAFVVCKVPVKMPVTDKVWALPWQQLEEIFSNNKDLSVDKNMQKLNPNPTCVGS